MPGSRGGAPPVAGAHPGGAHLDGDDVACLPEAHLPHLAARAAAHFPQVLQIVDFCLVALEGQPELEDPPALGTVPPPHLVPWRVLPTPQGTRARVVPGPRWSGSPSAS